MLVCVGPVLTLVFTVAIAGDSDPDRGSFLSLFVEISTSRAKKRLRRRDDVDVQGLLGIAIGSPAHSVDGCFVLLGIIYWR